MWKWAGLADDVLPHGQLSLHLRSTTMPSLSMHLDWLIKLHFMWWMVFHSLGHPHAHAHTQNSLAWPTLLCGALLKKVGYARLHTKHQGVTNSQKRCTDFEIFGFHLSLISDFGISVISEISNGISGKVYKIWQQLVTPCKTHSQTSTDFPDKRNQARTWLKILNSWNS